MSRDARVDAYIARAAPFALPILDAVRARVHDVIPDVEETLKWGHPTFVTGGKILLGMAAFKQHAAVNFWRGGEMGLDRSAGGMGQLGRLESVDDLPDALEFERLLRSAASLSAAAPLTRKKAAPKPAPRMHADFAAALEQAPKAKAALDGFTPSAQRDYLEWIGDAKQDATRAKRIATAVEWLGEGKKRNWRYENC